MIDRILDNLRSLLQLDTQNPPRHIDEKGPLVDWLRAKLAGFEIKLTDHGRGRLSLLAVRGQPRVLFNVHLDTVPAGDGWTVDPLDLTLRDSKAFGRGACDIKGAAACLLVLADMSSDDLALLFTTDEEGSASCCVTEFCKTDLARSYKAVVVAEPTHCRPVTSHRGYLSVAGEFSGTAMHTSQSRNSGDSAVHMAVRWSTIALDVVEQFERQLSNGHEGQVSCCFNIGRIDGGIKNNMVADRCRLTWSARVPPGVENDDLLGILDCRPDRSTTDSRPSWTTSFAGPSLLTPTDQGDLAAELVRACGFDAGYAVDFWTEASIFADAGLPAIVLGPGDIAQAHTPDEWIAVSQLEQALETYHVLAQLK